MKIIFTAQKGGPGKTTNCILFSNYLVLMRKQELLVLDMDFNKDTKDQWDEDRENFENPPLYEAIGIDLAKSAELMTQLDNVNGHVIIDLPGKLDDNNLIAIFKKADLAIVPFTYDARTVKNTLIIAQVIKHINPDAPLVFIPNRIKASVDYDKEVKNALTRSQVDEQLTQFGVIAPALPNKIAFERIDTLTIPKEIRSDIVKTYDFIYERFFVESTAN